MLPWVLYLFFNVHTEVQHSSLMPLIRLVVGLVLIPSGRAFILRQCEKCSTVYLKATLKQELQVERHPLCCAALSNGPSRLDSDLPCRDVVRLFSCTSSYGLPNRNSVIEMDSKRVFHLCSRQSLRFETHPGGAKPVSSFFRSDSVHTLAVKHGPWQGGTANSCLIRMAGPGGKPISGK